MPSRGVPIIAGRGRALVGFLAGPAVTLAVALTGYELHHTPFQVPPSR